MVDGANPSSRSSTSRARAASVFGEEKPPTFSAPATRGSTGSDSKSAAPQTIRIAHRQRYAILPRNANIFWFPNPINARHDTRVIPRGSPHLRRHAQPAGERAESRVSGTNALHGRDPSFLRMTNAYLVSRSHEPTLTAFTRAGPSRANDCRKSDARGVLPLTEMFWRRFANRDGGPVRRAFDAADASYSMAIEPAVDMRKAPFVVLIHDRCPHSLQIDVEHQVSSG